MSSPASVSPMIEGLIRDAQTGDAARAVLDWLAAPPAASALEETDALSRHLGMLDAMPVSQAARVRILDVFHDRALGCSEALKPALAACALPVEPRLRRAAESLCDTHMRLARTYLDALRARVAHRPVRAAGYAMVCVLDAYCLNSLFGAPDPAGMWGIANALLMYARMMAVPAVSAPGSIDAEQLYRQLVALALAQPPHLAPADFFSAAEYIRCYSGAVRIQTQPPHRDLDSWFWLDDEVDSGPTPLLRTPAPVGRTGHTLYCSCQRLGMVLGQHLDLLEGGSSAADLHLPEGLAQSATRRLLRSLQSRWMAMPRRQHGRRERVQQVRMLIGFEAIWQLLEYREQSAHWETASTHWIMVNDSPGGFALKLARGQAGLLRPGAPVLIKGTGSRNWMICVVRWARSARSDHVEAGVQLLSHGAQAATVVFDDAGNSERTPVAALRLPPLANQRTHTGLLLRTGTASSSHMLIAHVAGNRCRLGKARLSDLDLQTTAFDLFELEELGASESEDI
ncbi:MAG: hypothetical protein KKD25_07915 [Gammaproteobacteria bacterium]|nr:hypothetical protein [Gammaproteobacteria bacterium]MBU0770442.1 hypothetical protein [Gammaproteobacteria bacterium]MBU0855170.1 hypothetical protein [Gammaproteobacteria bacterium]MBU1847360.1 hypothetical protein [Gammaproteobacteria bacterium]